MVLGTIGKSLRFFFGFGYDFFMALDMFFLDLDMFFLRFFYGFGNGFGQNRKKIDSRDLGGIYVFFKCFFYDFGTVPYENRKKIVNKS